MLNFICRRSLLPHLSSSLRTSPLCRLFSLSLFSSSTTTPSSLSNSSVEHSFTVNYLINSCGFPPELALSVSKYVNIKTPKKPDAVLAVFKTYGFTDTQIVDVVKAVPSILVCDPEKTLLPKLEFFSSIGLPGPDLARFTTKTPMTPRILHSSLAKRIIPCYNFYRNLLQPDERTITMLKLNPLLLTHELQVNVVPNTKILRTVGVPESNITSYFTYHPESLRLSTNKFQRTVDEVEEMGFNPSMMIFMRAFHALKSLSKSNWEKKIELYKKWGWSQDDCLIAFGKYPLCMTISEDKITRVMDFLINKMGLQSSLLVNRPMLISLSLEKRIVPRCLYYQVLLDRGLIKREKDFRYGKWLEATEKNFIARITKNHKEEAPQLLKLYQEKLDLALQRTEW